MKRFLFALTMVAIIASFSTPGRAEDSMDLQRLISLSLQNDLEYDSLLDQKTAVNYSLEKDVDNLNPAYQLNYSHDHTEYLNSSTGRYEFGAGLSYPLNDGGRRRFRIESDRKRIEILDLNIMIRRRDVALSVYEDYMDYLESAQRKDVISKAIERAEYYREAAQTKIKSGAGVKLDLLEADAHLSTIRANLVSAEKNLDLAKLQLIYAVNADSDHFDISTETPAHVDIPEYSREVAMDRFKYAPEYLLVNIKSEYAGVNQRLTGSMTRPQFDISGGYRLSGPDSSLGDKAWQIGVTFSQDLGKNRTLTSSKSEARSVEDHVFQGGIAPVSISQKQESLRLTIHDGSSKNAELFSAAADALRADREIIESRQQIEKVILEKWYDLRAGQMQEAAMRNNVLAKEEALNSIRAEYELGLAPTQDLVEAETNLLNARMDLISATCDALLTEKQFLAAIGENPFPEAIK